MLRKLKSFDLHSKRILIRVDFNVPILDDDVVDDYRIRKTIPTIKHCIDQGAKVILMSHLGRPKGKIKPELSLMPTGEKLAELLEMPIKFSHDCVSEDAINVSHNLQPGEVHLLENLRFYNEETNNDSQFSMSLSKHGEIFINDAFGTAHREHASNVGIVSHFMNKGIGFLIEKELEFLSETLTDPSLPLLLIIGGAKIDTKIISELVLLGVCLPMNVSDELLTNAQSNNQDALNFITMWGHSNFSHLGQNIVPGIWLTGSSKKLLETSSKGVLFSDLMAVKNYKEDEKTLNKILCPTLIICGSEDMMTPLKNVVILEKNINKLSKIVLPNCGHMMMLEEPDIVRSEIASFLSSPSK